MRHFIVLIAVAISAQCLAADQPKTDAEKIHGTIDDAIAALTSNERERFIREFLGRDMLLLVLKDQNLKEASKELNREDMILSCLRHVKDSDPKFSKEGDIATLRYSGTKPPSTSILVTVIFEKVHDRWYIKRTQYSWIKAFSMPSPVEAPVTK